MKINTKFIPTILIDLFKYLIVGVIATIVEWLVFAVLNMNFNIHYAIATTVAYVLSTFANWLAGRLIMFKGKNETIASEIIKIYIVAVIGLLMNIFIMWLTVDIFNINTMIAKILATGVTFFWNFFIRKFIIYK